MVFFLKISQVLKDIWFSEQRCKIPTKWKGFSESRQGVWARQRRQWNRSLGMKPLGDDGEGNEKSNDRGIQLYGRTHSVGNRQIWNEIVRWEDSGQISHVTFGYIGGAEA